MNNHNLNWIEDFIWGIADDVLRDVYNRGKYRDVILPMVVIRRLDTVLESTKKNVLKMKKTLDSAKIVNQDAALRTAAGQAFYNTSDFTLRKLQARVKSQQLRMDFEAYLDGFSPNVQEILEKFKFRNQIPTMIDADILGSLIEKFLDPSINLGPEPVLNLDGTERLPALDNHAMGTIFEELIRRFNEENNEEAGEHFTPRDVVKLMADLIFLPISEKIESATYLVYDGACGTGGMLTVSEERLHKLADQHGKDVSIHLFGQEVNPEIYAITKADLLLKGEGGEVENFRFGSTLSQDGFKDQKFDFMLSNPPYGKSWKNDLERMGGKSEMCDPRFIINHAGNSEYRLLTRSSDGQLMFLVNKISKMKNNTLLGSRIVEVHNGSSLFTGDAGQGESNIRRWIIESDWLEAIIALPLNIFYNTGIATYIWVLSNRKPENRKGKVQLIDATWWSKPLRKNLGKKNCELSSNDIKQVITLFLDFEENDCSKIFSNSFFGYYNVKVERPLRLLSQFTSEAVESLLFASGDETVRLKLYKHFGQDIFEDFPSVKQDLEDLFLGKTKESKNIIDKQFFDSISDLSEKQCKKIVNPETWKRDFKLHKIALELWKYFGDKVYDDHNEFQKIFFKAIKKAGIKLKASEKNIIINFLSRRDQRAKPVIARILKKGKNKPNPLYGCSEIIIDGKACLVEYQPDNELTDYEQVPLMEKGGIRAFFKREVLPYIPDAWINKKEIKIGYEISFSRYFYKPKILRTLEEIRNDIESLEKESEGLLNGMEVERGDKK